VSHNQPQQRTRFGGFRSQLVLASKRDSYYIPRSVRLGFARDGRMKHPIRSGFDTAVTEAGVTVTFKHGQRLHFS